MFKRKTHANQTSVRPSATDNVVDQDTAAHAAAAALQQFGMSSTDATALRNASENVKYIAEQVQGEQDPVVASLLGKVLDHSRECGRQLVTEIAMERGLIQVNDYAKQSPASNANSFDPPCPEVAK